MDETLNRTPEACALCGASGPHGPWAPAGVRFCAACLAADPAAGLTALGIPSEWNTRLGWFNVGLGIPEADEGLVLRAVSRLWMHRLLDLVQAHHRVGDPDFDAAIRTTTSNPTRAATVLTPEVREAILRLLGHVRRNELAVPHVTLRDRTLVVQTRPLGGLDAEREQELRITVAALAIELRRIFTNHREHSS